MMVHSSQTVLLLLLFVIRPISQSKMADKMSSISSDTNSSARTDPCSDHRCADGQQCVVHTIACLQQPCPLIGECTTVDSGTCRPPCPAGYRCRHQLGAPPVCVAGGSGVDACDGRCRATDAECVSYVQPCARPPCSVLSQCVPRARRARAHTEPQPERGPAAGACVVPCAAGEHCAQVPTPCGQSACPLVHRCVVDDTATGSTVNPVTESDVAVASNTGNRHETRPTAPPVCLVPCTDNEKCRLHKPHHCRDTRCQPLPRCVPKRHRQRQQHQKRPHTTQSAATDDTCAGVQCADGYRCVPTKCPAGRRRHRRCRGCVALDAQVSANGTVLPYCPVDTLTPLLAPGACSNHQLDMCGAQTPAGNCGATSGQLCCPRGCGRVCVAACRRACRRNEQCQLVTISCLVSPCPSESQCVYVGRSVTTTSIATNSNNQNRRPSSKFPTAVHTSIAQIDEEERETLPPQLHELGEQCGNRRCRVDQVCRPEWCSAADNCRHSLPLHCVPAVPQRSGQCPIPSSTPQNPSGPSQSDYSASCFVQSPVTDQCSSDFECAPGERCCHQHCARRCVSACQQQHCAPGHQCRMITNGTLPAVSECVPVQ